MILSTGSSIKDGQDRLYFLDEIIGQGGFGYVFKAHRQEDNAVFAVKTMLPSFNDLAAEVAFKNEIQSATQVRGNNIIHYEFVHTGDTFPNLPPYIIMEYADGGTLTSILKQRQAENRYFEVEELLRIFKQLANGMQEISSILVHRDIKPDNILLCNETLKISDFGLSKVAAENTRTMTFKGGGTPLYMAPEAWDFSKNTVQMDIYSMGIVFYELASLRYPYDPVPHTLEEYKNTHLCSPIIALEKRNPQLPPSLISVINRMLEKSTKRRFSEWQEIIAALEKQKSSESTIDKLVAMAVATTNAQDSARQAEENLRKQKEKEKADFCKLIHSQFENTIIAPIVDFIEKFNTQYAGNEKINYDSDSQIGYRRNCYYWRMSPSGNDVTINLEIVLKDSHRREVPIDRLFGEGRTRTVNYTPQYKGKDILAWAEIKNRKNYGFNLLLLDSGEIFGDWLIMNNKNNLSHLTNKERPEPFAFSLQELPAEIDKVQITSLYTADFIPFDTIQFLNLIKQLAFDLA